MTFDPCHDPAVASLLGSIREAIAAASGSSLVGLYLFRSLATGDFEAGVSESTFLPSSPMLPASDWPRLRRQDGAATVPETRRFVTEMAELERAR